MVPCNGYGSHVLQTHEGAGAASVLDSLSERADGAILLEWSRSIDFASHLEAQEFPYVVCNLEEQANVVATRIDHADVGRQAAAALAGAGYKRPLVFCGSSSRHVFARIRHGFRQEWPGRSIRWRECAGRVDAMRTAMLAEVEGGVKFDAVFAYGDQRVAAVLHALAACGLDTPENCGLLGYGRLVAELRAAGVAMLKQPVLELGRRAAKMLQQQLLGHRPKPRQAVLPVTLIAGETLADDHLPPGDHHKPSRRVS
jgi:LacI family transcriptional regulator, repressor for deo operon, udp, cdd, tsx, nupC, and nupG